MTKPPAAGEPGSLTDIAYDTGSIRTAHEIATRLERLRNTYLRIGNIEAADVLELAVSVVRYPLEKEGTTNG